MNIVTWDEYNSLYSKVSEADFSRYEALAEKEVKKVIGAIKWESINTETFGYDALKDCICNVIDKIYDDERNGRGRGLTSVSNDGYSESYALVNPSDLRGEMVSFIKSCLSGTGLVGAY